MTTNQPTRWPIRQVRVGFFVLEDIAGNRISWHRTKSGALRRRRELIEADESFQTTFKHWQF
jgi:hypothetical protein